MTEHAQPHHPHSPEEVEAMLSLATVGDLQREVNGPSAVDVTQLTAHEIVSALQRVAEASARVPINDHDYRDPSPQDRRLDEYSDHLIEAMDKLPNLVGVDRTKEVFALMVGSSSADVRCTAGICIDVLAKVDREYGLKLWRQLLLEDPDPKVAETAWRTARDYFGDMSFDKPEESKQRLAEAGLTWQDLSDLVNDYISHLQDFRDRNTYPDGLAS